MLAVHVQGQRQCRDRVCGCGGEGAYSVDDHSCCLHVLIQQATGERKQVHNGGPASFIEDERKCVTRGAGKGNCGDGG